MNRTGGAWLAALVVGLGLSVGWFYLRPPPAPPLPRPAPGDAPPQVDGVAGQPPVPAGSREAALDQVEAAEAQTLGAEEAARRRRLRERMLDLRAEEAGH